MNKASFLVVDTQINGHHILWLQMVAKSLLANGVKVVLLVNHDRATVIKRLELLDANLTTQIQIIAASQHSSLSKFWRELTQLSAKYACSKIILNNFDSVASTTFRLAAFGFMPPKVLKNKLIVIYHRPRPLDIKQTGVTNYWKRLGFKRMLQANYFAAILLLDQYLQQQLVSGGLTNCYFLPDPWQVCPNTSKPTEITQLNNKQIYILQYGVGDKRKGSELLIHALLATTNLNTHLILAGTQKDPRVLDLVIPLVKQGRATLINRFILDSEEAWLFQHTTWVSLPYLSHYGSSNLLAKAAYYQRPVIASDFHLLGRNVRDYLLGLCFVDQNLNSLINLFDNLTMDCLSCDLNAQQEFVKLYSFAAFAKNLANALGLRGE